MTGAIRCGVAVFIVGVLGLSVAAAAGAEPKRPPSALLPLETLWTGELPAAPAWAPVHAGGQLFVALRDGHLVAVSLADGKVTWDVERTVVAQPAVGERLLFVAGEDELAALETTTGTEVWSIPLEAPLSAPLVWNMHWLIAPLEAGTVLALRGDDGETMWRRTLDAGIVVPPALAGDRMYVSLNDGGLVALSLLSGESLWERQLDGAPQQVLPLDDLFVGAGDNNFYRLSKVDGSVQWRWPTGGDIVGAPAVDGARVFFSSLDNVVWALDRASGVQRWRKPLAARPTAGPSYVGDLLVFGGLSREITFYKPSDGTLYGRVSVAEDLAFPPLHLAGAIGQPTLVFVTGDGLLQALGPSTSPLLLDPAVTAIFGKAPAKKAFVGKESTDAASPETPPTAASETPATADSESPGPVPDAVSVLTPVPPLTPATSGDAVPAPIPVSPTIPAIGAAGAAPPDRPSVGGEYAIQVAAFGNEVSATALADELADAAFPAYVVGPLPGDDPQLYRVRIGDFPDRESAETAGQRVADDRALDWYIVALP